MQHKYSVPQHEVGSRVVKSTATLLQVPVKSIAADKLYADAH